jgi:hypothetical protein
MPLDSESRFPWLGLLLVTIVAIMAVPIGGIVMHILLAIVASIVVVTLFKGVAHQLWLRGQCAGLRSRLNALEVEIESKIKMKLQEGANEAATISRLQRSGYARRTAENIADHLQALEYHCGQASRLCWFWRSWVSQRNGRYSLTMAHSILPVVTKLLAQPDAESDAEPDSEPDTDEEAGVDVTANRYPGDGDGYADLNL